MQNEDFSMSDEDSCIPREDFWFSDEESSISDADSSCDRFDTASPDVSGFEHPSQTRIGTIHSENIYKVASKVVLATATSKINFY